MGSWIDRLEVEVFIGVDLQRASKRTAVRYPDPMGARISMSSPSVIAGQPRPRAPVSATMIVWNQALTADEMRAGAVPSTLPSECDNDLLVVGWTRIRQMRDRSTHV